MGEEDDKRESAGEDDMGGWKVFRRPDGKLCIVGGKAGDEGAGDTARDGFLESASSAFTREIPPIGRTVLRR